MSSSTNTSRFVKMPSKRLLDFLMDCHEREMMGMPPNAAWKFAAKTLETKELVYSKLYKLPSGKVLLCAFISDKGKEYLDKWVKC